MKSFLLRSIFKAFVFFKAISVPQFAIEKKHEVNQLSLPALTNDPAG